MARLLTVLTALLSPLAARAQDTKQEPALYLPTKVGAKWVYEWHSAEKKETQEAVEVVTAVTDGTAGASIVTVGRVGAGGRVYPSKSWEVSEHGLFWTVNHWGQPISRPICFLQLPLKPGQRWGDASSGNKVMMTAHGPEQLKVPAGEFSCIRVEQRTERSPDPQITWWHAPNVGLVKWHCGDLTTSLTSFSPSK